MERNFVGEKLTIIQRVVKNSASLIFAKIISLIFTAGFGIFAARQLGNVLYGRYAFIVVLIAYFLITSNFGLRDIITRDISRKKEKSSEYLFTSIVLKTVTTIVSIGMMYLFARILGRGDILEPIIIASFSLIPIAIYMSFEAVFRAYEKMEYLAITDILYSILRIVVGIFILVRTHNLVALFWGFLLVEFVRVLIITVFYKLKINRFFVWKIKAELFKYLIGSSYLLMLWEIMGIIYYKSDILILSKIAGDAVVGWYNAAAVLIGMFIMISSICISVILPVVSQLYIDSREKLKKLYGMIFKYSIVLIVPVVLLLIGFANSIIPLVFGQQYQNSIAIFRILIWTFLFMSILGLQGVVIIVSDLYKKMVKVLFLNAVAKIILVTILTHRFSYIGTSVACILADLISISIFVPYVCQHLGYNKLFLEISKPLILTLFIISFAFLIQYFSDISLPFVFSIGTIVYIILLFRVNIISKSDIHYIKRLAGLA